MNSFLINPNTEIGIDEAGRGPLIGRVYAGAVIWGDVSENTSFITDSKKLTPKKRAVALEWITHNVKAFGVGWAEPNEIDDINILEATKLAMDRAIIDLKQKYNFDNDITLLIDGTGWEKKFTNYKTKSIIKGDSKILSIAAASIIAKEYHDKYITDLCAEYPELNIKYDLLKNMGYGTKKHIDGIRTHGYSNYHRKSFKCKNL
jgi:ribonuclease HII